MKNLIILLFPILLTSLWDVQKALLELKKVCNKNTKVIISTYNSIWEPILKFAEFFGLKSKQPIAKLAHS